MLRRVIPFSRGHPPVADAARRTSTRGAKSPLNFSFKYGPRSRAEWWGMVLGASLAPAAILLLNWYEGRSIEPVELAPDLSSPTSVTLAPKQQLGGPFKLRESRTGEYITDADLFKDHWTLLYFGFSKCAEICPSTLAFIASVMKECDTSYGASPALQEQQLQAAFLSIDFIRDKPSVVERFVARFDPRIRGLCGSRAEVEQAARAWRVYYSSVDETEEEREAREAKGIPEPVVDDTYQFDHSSAIYLVGPDGKMKDFFFREMGTEDVVSRLGVHFSDVYGFSDTRKHTEQ